MFTPLFDRGYLGVHPQKKILLVTPHLRSDWGNGEEFYQRAMSGKQSAFLDGVSISRM